MAFLSLFWCSAFIVAAASAVSLHYRLAAITHAHKGEDSL
ncbi:hypothetical protein SANTM175S_04494 [Streptomyces antimycoticus]